jgi:hypothetical protein
LQPIRLRRADARLAGDRRAAAQDIGARNAAASSRCVDIFFPKDAIAAPGGKWIELAPEQ